MPNEAAELAGLGARLDSLETHTRMHDARIQRLEDAMGVLRTDVARISEHLESVPTKVDAAHMEGRLSTKIDQTFNGLLQKALDSSPLKGQMIWAGVLALMTLGLLLVAALPHGL